MKDAFIDIILRQLRTRALFWLVVVLVSVQAVLWMTQVTIEKPELVTEPESKNELMPDLNAILGLSEKKKPLGDYVSESGLPDLPDVCGLPSWIVLSTADIREMMKQMAGESSGGLAGLSLPEVRKELTAEEMVFGTEDEPSKVIPYVYSGWMKLNGLNWALIEDRQSGTSYFRTSGDALANFIVMEVSKESLLLCHKESARQICLKRAVEGNAP